MADYYPLIARAVDGLEKNTGENRRSLYDRARVALATQLRGIEPALEETEITRERLALEEAIRKVEAEAAKRPRAVAESEEPSLRDRALRDFRETVAEAEELGGAAAEARRAAQETSEAITGDEVPSHDIAPPQWNGKDGSFRADTETGDDYVPLPSAPPFEDEEVYARPARSYVGLIKIGVILLAVLGIVGVGYWQRQNISSMFANFRSQPPPKKETAQPAVRPKIADRIGQSGEANSNVATAPAAAVAQKVVLYDEDPSDPQGKRYIGSALWRTETVSPGPGMAPELAVRADIEIPERKLRMTWSLRRNTDKALPASHTIEIMFNLPADFSEGGIGNVPGVLMKQNEQARGVPLAGLAVKVTNGYFLIGLSAVEVDVQRNIQLLKDRDWFDIPVVYTSGKRAILAMEKGTPGSRAFEEAFRAWGQ
ncbi:MAG TPA: hypothetical protein VFP60_00535 [Pseudolabrys sp.]|nr:hypothetical protein [Pseudolabrys sp.]